MTRSAANPAAAARDRPDVLVFPPVILLATIALAGVLQWLLPPGVLARLESPSAKLAGGGIALVGLAVMIRGHRALVRRGTNVDPRRPALALVRDGAYRWTRNPIYVGGLIAIAGIALGFALDWLLLLLPLSLLVLHVAVVRREERYLERKFGAAYRQYKASVARYVWPF